MSNQLGKTIQIYCPNGEPRGVRIAELTTRILQALVVPRSKLEQALVRPELAKVGVYFLFGRAETDGRDIAYVGEAEDCAARFKEHNLKKEFWSVAVALVSRTDSFTKAHVRMLEWLSIRRAAEAGRFQLDNANSGIEPVIPEWMRADIAEIFETADVLLSVVGYPIFEKVGAGSEGERRLFYCRRAGADARGVYGEDGFVVLAGSMIRSELTDSARESQAAKREALKRAGVLKATAKGLRFERDHLFATPSAAATLVAGNQANGWDEWKDSDGKTLDQAYR